MLPVNKFALGGHSRLTTVVFIGSIACLAVPAKLSSRVKSVEARLAAIRVETDQNRKNLLVAEIVSELFRRVGADPVIVGGSAVEFYTDGAYVSADGDVCFAGARLPSPRERESILAEVGLRSVCAHGRSPMLWLIFSERSRQVHGLLFRKLGELSLIQIEDLIAERILIATTPRFDEERWQVAKVLLAVALKKMIAFDRAELERIVNSPDYRVGQELLRLIGEIESEK